MAKNENALPEVHTQEKADVINSNTGKPKGKILVSGAEYYDFEKDQNPFVGMYTGREAKREKDGKEENQKAGSVMGYYFITPDGEETIIGNSHSVQKSMADCKKDDVVYFEFLGKNVLDSGRTVNRFEIILLDKEEHKKYGF